MWEVRPTNGLDTNGGGFVAGATGTDYSQQNAKNSGGTDSSTTDAVAVATTTITSATASFGTSIVGNIIYFQGGTGSIAAQWRQVTARASSTSITIDAAIGSSTGMTMNIGGALQTLTTAFTNASAASHKIFVKNESTITTATGFTMTGVATNTAGTPRQYLSGYTSTRGDNGKATIQLITNTGLTALTTSVYVEVTNLIIDCNSLGTSRGASIGNDGMIYGCLVKNFTSSGIAPSSSSAITFNCEVTAGTSAATAGIASAAQASIFGCYIHDNVCPGISLGAGGNIILKNVIANNSGASSDGITWTANVATTIDNIFGNTIYNNGRHGLFFNTNTGNNRNILGNLFANNGGYGINMNTTAGTRAATIYDGNGYYANTSGTRNNMDDTTTNKQNGVAPYTNVFDVVCTTTPFVNAAGGDWRLNQTGTGGGLLRGYGVPQTWSGLSGNKSFPDMGAAQHQDPGFAG